MTRLTFSMYVLFASTIASLSEGQAIAGRVREASSNQPIAGAVVTVKGKSLKTITDSSGSYALNNVGTGVFTVVATKVHFYPSVQEDVSGGGTADFELLGVKYGLSGKLIVAAVSEQQARDLLRQAKIADDPQAIYLLSNKLASANSLDTAIHRESLAAAETLKNHPTKISGAVTDSNGGPIVNANVELRNMDTGDTVQTMTDSSGHYQASVFPVGGYDLEVHSKGQDAVANVPAAEVGASTNVTRDVSIHKTTEPHSD